MSDMKLFTKTFIKWLPLGVAITMLCGLIHVSVQQNYRQGLNDPQIQMAEDAARYLAKDYTPAAVVPRGQSIDIAQSLAPWIAVYDESGKVLESSAVLDGKPPMPPHGVFDTTHWKDPIVGHHLTADVPANQNRVSWESASGVRNAIVIAHIEGSKGGFVIAGRNMREVEEREGSLMQMIALGWIAILIGTFLAALITRRLS